MKRPLQRTAARRTVACVLAGAVSAVGQTASEAPVDLSLVTHNAVTIAAPAERIWLYIVEPDAWKAGAQLVPVEGAEDRFQAVMPNDPDTPLYHVRNVELDPPVRRTIRLNALDGALIGFATWELTPANGGTRVAYHVYSQQEAPPGFPAIDREAYLEDNRRRFQEELNSLKALVERAD